MIEYGATLVAVAVIACYFLANYTQCTWQGGIIVLFIFAVVIYWILSNLALQQPAPPVLDGDFSRLVDEFRSYPTEVWFRNCKAFFEQQLDCTSAYRYVIFESDGKVVYDSDPYYPSHEKAKALPLSYEYMRAVSFQQGASIRGQTNNAAFSAIRGNRQRIVHISEYIYGERDRAY